MSQPHHQVQLQCPCLVLWGLCFSNEDVPSSLSLGFGYGRGISSGQAQSQEPASPGRQRVANWWAAYCLPCGGNPKIKGPEPEPTYQRASKHQCLLGSKPDSAQLLRTWCFTNIQQQQWPDQILPTRHSHLVRNGDEDTTKRCRAGTHKVSENWELITDSYLKEPTQTLGEIAKMLYYCCNSSFSYRNICLLQCQSGGLSAGIPNPPAPYPTCEYETSHISWGMASVNNKHFCCCKWGVASLSSRWTKARTDDLKGYGW